MGTITVTEKLVTETCCNCAMTFAVPEDFQDRRMKDHKTYYCPSGHGQNYFGKTEEDKLREQLASKEREVAAAKSRADNERERRIAAQNETQGVVRSLRATRAVVTRTKRKLVAGRCPCCSHSFPDLKKHMKVEHPKYDPDKAVAALEAKA